MVKAATTKPTKIVKAVDAKKYASATSLKSASEDDNCTQTSELMRKTSLTV